MVNGAEVTDTAAWDFANTYDLKPTSITFEVLKKLNGRTLTDGEFLFRLAPLGTGDGFLVADVL